MIPDLLAGLNDAQRQAVTTVHGPVLVVAGPGSGKTRVLVNRIAYLIEHEGVPPGAILAVTFTNKAAREMRDRITRLLGDATEPNHPAARLSDLWMGTFHSFGVRVLRQNPGLVLDRLGIQPNFLIYDDSEQQTIVKRALEAEKLDPKHYAPRRVLSAISRAKGQLYTPAEFREQVMTYDDEIVARVYSAYQRLLAENHAVDFDDLLVLPVRLFDQAPNLLTHYQHRFQHILVDEYQDTNRIQYILVSALAEQHRNLFVVGDPDQSIYGWRQADIRNILDFQTEFSDATRIDLELNYRSTGRIVAVADSVIRANTERIDRGMRTENPDGDPIVVRELNDGEHEARWIVDEVRRLQTVRRFSGDDIAVMYRTNAQSRVLEEAFRTSGIPYRIVGGLRFYERKEVKDLLAVLRLLHNPADGASIERVLGAFQMGRGFGPKALEQAREWARSHGEPLLAAFVAVGGPIKLEDTPRFAGAAKTAAVSLGKYFAALQSELGHLPLPELYDRALELSGYEQQFDQNNEEELQRLLNVKELRNDLEQYATLPLDEQLPSFLDQMALVSDADTMEDDGRGRVTMITLHSAKGLEFPVVFLAGVEESVLPSYRAVEAEFQDPKPMEEERRLFYVGITRAEKLLYVTYAAHRMSFGRSESNGASRFLLQVPEMHVNRIERPKFGTGRSLGDRVREPAYARGATGSGMTRLPGPSGRGRTETDDWTNPAYAEPAPPPPPAHEFVAGEKVFHSKYGEGEVVEVIKRRDGDQEVAVLFARHGQKRLMASLAKLDVITDDGGRQEPVVKQESTEKQEPAVKHE